MPAESSLANKKALEFQFFVAATQKTITFSNLRASLDVDKAGGMMMGTGKAKIYGVPREIMDEVTTLQWRPRTLLANTVTVYAIDGQTRTMVFHGNVVNAWGDYQSAPDVYLYIHAQSAFFEQTQTPPPRSYNGPVLVAKIMELLAGELGVSFENNGVTAVLASIYLRGSNVDQIRALAKAAGIDYYLDGKTLAICPANQPRAGVAPVLSPSTGMVGYPTFDGYGVTLHSLFNPAVIHGGQIKVESSVGPASGFWIVTSVSLRLESEKPGGAWFMTIRGNEIGLAIAK